LSLVIQFKRGGILLASLTPSSFPIFPSASNDDINIDSIITLSRKQVFNGLLVKKGTSVGLLGQNKSQLIRDLIPIQTLKKLLVFIED
jgi:hypothetical protein